MKLSAHLSHCQRPAVWGNGGQSGWSDTKYTSYFDFFIIRISIRLDLVYDRGFVENTIATFALPIFRILP